MMILVVTATAFSTLQPTPTRQAPRANLFSLYKGPRLRRRPENEETLQERAWRSLTTSWRGGFIVGLLVAMTVASPVTDVRLARVLESSATREAAAQFEAVLDVLERNYVENVEAKDLFMSAVESMASRLDPYTEFENKRDADILTTEFTGSYGGVGMVVGKQKDSIVVVEPFEGYAYEAGVRTSDLVTRVDDEPTTGKTPDDVSNLLRGKPGTSVNVEVQHAWEQERSQYVLQRTQVHKPDLELATLFDRVAYVRLARFSRDSATEVQAALELLRQASGNSLVGVVLDLRGNPGGVLESAVELASLFADNGQLIVSCSGRGDAKFYEARAVGPAEFAEPLAVLVDRNSASASEVVAGFVQDVDRGVVVGQRTFGKGLIQDLVDLPYGAKLKVTIGKYTTPSGRSLQEVDYSKKKRLSASSAAKTSSTFATARGRPVASGAGIVPDVVVDADDDLSSSEQFLVRTGILDKFVDSWLARKSDLAADLYARSEQLVALNGQARTPPKHILNNGDILDLERFALDAIDEDAAASDDAAVKKIATEQRAKVVADLKGSFRARNDKIRRIADDAVRARFFRSSANLRLALNDDAQLTAALNILADGPRYDALLEPASAAKATTQGPQIPS